MVGKWILNVHGIQLFILYVANKVLSNTDHMTPIVLTSFYRQHPQFCREDLRRAIIRHMTFSSEIGRTPY